MDPFALRAANRLVGNPPQAAVLEFALDPPLLEAEDDCLVAAAGPGYDLWVGGRRVGAWRAAAARKGETLRLVVSGAPGWGYLAVAGGIEVEPVMGSRSTYLRGGFGGWQGRALQAGDVLPSGPPARRDWWSTAGRYLPPARRPVYGRNVSVPVVPGPQAEAFTAEAQQLFFNAEYSVTMASDRMGYRLDGPPLAHKGKIELISEPLAWGAVQVPPDGKPVVLLSDRPTTGGYPKIATVARAGIPLLVQAVPGIGRVRFYPVSVSEAQALYREQMVWLETGIEEEVDDA